MTKMQKIRIHTIMEMRTAATRKKSFRAGRAKVRPAFLPPCMCNELPKAGDRVENREDGVMRIIADAMQIDPRFVAPVIGAPILLAALLVMILRPLRRKKRRDEQFLKTRVLFCQMPATQK